MATLCNSSFRTNLVGFACSHCFLYKLVHLNDDDNDVDDDADDSEYDDDSYNNLMMRKTHVHIIFV